MEAFTFVKEFLSMQVPLHCNRTHTNLHEAHRTHVHLLVAHRRYVYLHVAHRRHAYLLGAPRIHVHCLVEYRSHVHLCAHRKQVNLRSDHDPLGFKLMILDSKMNVSEFKKGNVHTWESVYWGVSLTLSGFSALAIWPVVMLSSQGQLSCSVTHLLRT